MLAHQTGNAVFRGYRPAISPMWATNAIIPMTVSGQGEPESGGRLRAHQEQQQRGALPDAHQERDQRVHVEALGGDRHVERQRQHREHAREHPPQQPRRFGPPVETCFEATGRERADRAEAAADNPP
jgi:hypothetical protein